MNVNPVEIVSAEHLEGLIADRVIVNNTIISYTCTACNCHVIKKMKLRRNHKLLCRKCMTEDTNLKKYGCRSHFQNSNIRKKIRDTFLKKYGVDNNMKSAKGIAAWRKAYKEKTGYDHNWQNPECRSKCVKTSLEKYGADNYNNREKIEATNIEHCGFTCNFRSPDTQKKARQTCRKRYGCDYALQNDCIKDKQRKTCREKYGMDHHPLFKYIYNEINFDSSWELAYYIWLKDNEIDFVYPCDIIYEYVDSRGVKRTYQPDFRVGDKIIEIKGSQFINNNGDLSDPYDIENESTKLLSHDRSVAKTQIIKEHGIIIMSTNEIMPYIEYVKNTYGKDYLKSFKKKP